MNKFLKNLLGLFLNLSLFTLTYIVPKDKNLYLCGARVGKSFAGNSKYIYLYANKIKKNNKFVWITENKQVYQMLKEKNLPVVKKYSIKGFWSILKARKLIISNTSRDIAYFSFLLGSFKIVELWHGNPIKSIKFPKPEGVLSKFVLWGLKKEYKNIDFVLHTCQKTKKSIEEGFLTKKIKILGYPRNDRLFNTINFEKLPDLRRYKKVFFYMPTFRDKKSSQKAVSKKALIKLNNLMKKRNSIFLIKKHFAEKNWEDIKGYSNIMDISYIGDPYEILPKVDCLISDYSSVLYDFSLLSKPIIFYPYDYDEYKKKSRKIVINYFKDLPGPFVYNESDLLKLIKSEQEWFNKKEYEKKYKIFLNTFNKFKDANSSKRIYKEIIQ